MRIEMTFPLSDSTLVMHLIAAARTVLRWSCRTFESCADVISDLAPKVLREGNAASKTFSSVLFSELVRAVTIGTDVISISPTALMAATRTDESRSLSNSVTAVTISSSRFEVFAIASTTALRMSASLSSRMVSRDPSADVARVSERPSATAAASRTVSSSSDRRSTNTSRLASVSSVPSSATNAA